MRGWAYPCAARRRQASPRSSRRNADRACYSGNRGTVVAGGISVFPWRSEPADRSRFVPARIAPAFRPGRSPRQPFEPVRSCHSRGSRGPSIRAATLCRGVWHPREVGGIRSMPDSPAVDSLTDLAGCRPDASSWEHPEWHATIEKLPERKAERVRTTRSLALYPLRRFRIGSR